MIVRRNLLLGGAALGLAAAGKPPALREAARQMALYGLPLIEMAANRERTFKRGLPANRLFHARALSTAKTQTVTQANNDTLYSTAWLDLSRGPVRLTLPAGQRRYVSVALMDAWTNNIAVLHPGADGGETVIAGPSAPAGGAAVRSPTDWVWLLGRTLVDGEADLAAAHAVQDALRLQAPAGRAPGTFARRDAPWPEYFAAVQALMLESPPPAADHAWLRRHAALGVTLSGGFDPARFDAAAGREIAQGLSDAMAYARGQDAAGVRRGGWIYPSPAIGRFGQDFACRAQTALGLLAALPVSEAVYLTPVAPDGGPAFDSAKAWRLRFPAGGLPPVDAFWSLTLYERTPDGQGFFADNPIGRYAIGDRTPGLVRGAGGSLDILISAADPGESLRPNWLPAPTSGRPFQLTLRAYRPKPALLAGGYRLPPLVPA